MARPLVSGEDGSAFDPAAQASFDLRLVRGFAVVVSAGEIDLCTGPAFREALSRAAESSDRVVVDLTAVALLDSSGIAVIVDALRHNHRERRGSLSLVGPSGTVRKVLDITHLATMLPIYPTVAEALEAQA